MLVIKNLNLKYGKQIIFDNACLALNNTGLYALRGRNGLGKTTLLKCIKGIVSYKGEITYNGNEINKDDVAYLSSKNRVFSNLNLKEHLCLFSDNKAKIDKIIDSLELGEIKRVSKASAGERQRIALAVAILEDKPILLLDEGTSHIDYKLSSKVYKLLQEEANNKLIIIAIHDKTLEIDKDIYLKNGNFELSNQGIEKDELASNTYTNKYLLFKVLNRLNKPLFIILESILLIFLCFIINMNYIDEIYIYDSYLNNSSYYYTLEETYLNTSKYASSLDTTPISEYLVNSIDYDGIVYENWSLLDFIAMNENLEDSIILNSLIIDNISDYYITDTYNGISIKENELYISDFMFSLLRGYGLISQNRIVVGNTSFSLRMFSTNYNYYRTNKNWSDADTQRYYDEFNYVYHAVYLTETTYNNLKLAVIDKKTSFNLSSALIYDNSLELSSGTLPTNELECAVSTKYLEENYDYDISIGDEIYVFLTISYEPYLVTNITTASLETYEEFYFKTFKITGIVDSDESIIIFDSEESYYSFFEDNFVEKVNYYFINISKEDINIVLNSGYFFTCVDNYEIFSAIAKLDSYLVLIDPFLMIGLIIFLSIFILFEIIDILLNRNNNLTLKEKTINRNDFYKIKFLSSILDIVIAVISLIAGYLMFYYLINNYLASYFSITKYLLQFNYIYFIIPLILLIFYLFKWVFKRH